MGVESVEPEDAERGGEGLFGAALRRREDPELVTGEAGFTDDVQHPDTVHMAVLRSQYAHARIESIDTSAAAAEDGVHAVYTGEDLADDDVPGVMAVWVGDEAYATYPDRPILARGRTRYQGEPVAVVVAEERYAASEATELIDVDYDRLDAVTDPVEAIEGDAPTLHEEAPDNLAIDWEHGDEGAVEEALASADHVVEFDLVNNRLIPTAMEPRAVVARYRPSSEQLTVEMTSQNPHLHQQWLGETLGLPDHRIRVRAPSVGGGFGSKIHHYPSEALASWCAMRLERPVKWQATRSEGFSSTSHGRDHRADVEMGFDDGGNLLGMRTTTHVGVGGYVSSAQASVAAPDYAELLCGSYDVPAFHARVIGAFTNTTPVDAYRGAGRPEAAYLIERAMGKAAAELGIDPVELRRKNFIPAGEFPFVEVPAGRTYDSGDYEKPLEAALEHVDYESFRERQAEAREEGRYLGIGFSSYIEACGVGPGLFSSGNVQFKPSGRVIVRAGTHSHGQGHRTSFAQIVADRLGVPYDDIEVIEGDTAMVPEGNGTYGSRSGPVAGSAIVESAEKIVSKARRIAAHQLEAAPEDVAFEDGEFHVAGAPERAMNIQEVADTAYGEIEDLPEGEELGLDATTFYDPPEYTFPFGTHVAIVEVDPETGAVAFERYVAVDDVGNQINPKIVEGQIHGGIAQGLGQALYEGAVYDENGNLATGSLQDYAIPKAEHVPEMETDSTVTECPHNPLGVKGVGEAGTIAAPPAVVNAVVDALEPFDVEHLDMPLTPETVWQAVENGDGDGAS
jgi:carbon-monoxide dehydrogenase large subunit